MSAPSAQAWRRNALYWQFTAWLYGASASLLLRVITGWPLWRIAEAASIVAVSGFLLSFAKTTRTRRRPEWGVVGTALLGWLVISAVGALMSGNVVAGVDTILYLPAIVVMLLGTRRAGSSTDPD